MLLFICLWSSNCCNLFASSISAVLTLKGYKMVMVKRLWLVLVLVLLTEARPKILFYRYFTPMKLVRDATFIYSQYSLKPRLLTFLGAPKNIHRLMVVPLIGPGVIGTNANIVIKMAVGLEKSFSVADSDPSFVVSDGNRFIGALTLDKNNYRNHAPCLGMEGVSEPTLSGYHNDARLPKPSESYYPGRFEIQLNLSERWGTCFVALDGGFSREMFYQNKLKPGKGLSLDIYGDGKQEKEGIKYIEMTIMKES